MLILIALCLAAAVAVLGSSLPFLYWKTFCLECTYKKELEELSRRIGVLDEVVDQLLERIGVPKDGES